VDAGVEGADGAARGLHAHRREQVGRSGQPHRFLDDDGGVGLHELRPVDEREPVLRPQRDGRQPLAREHVGRRAFFSAVPELSLADEREGEVGQRREVARGAEAAAAGHDGHEPAARHLQQAFQYERGDAREPEPQRVRLQAQHPSRDGGRDRRAHADGVATEEVDLKPLHVGAPDARAGEGAEAGVEAVVRLAVVQRRFYQPAARLHARGRSAQGVEAPVEVGVEVGEAERHGAVPAALVGRHGCHGA